MIITNPYVLLSVLVGGVMAFGIWKWVGDSGSSRTITVVGDHPGGGGAQVRELEYEGKTVDWELEDGEALPITIDEGLSRQTPNGKLYYANLESGEVYLPDWRDKREPSGAQVATPEQNPGIQRIDAWTLKRERDSDTIAKIHRKQDDAYEFWIKLAPWAAGVIISLLLVMLYMMAG